MPQLKTAILLTNLSVYQFNQRLWDFKVDCLGHNLYLFCTILICLSFFCNVSHINYLSKYTRGKNLIWANRSFHKSIFIWNSFDSNRHFLRAFKYIALTLQFYKFMNVVSESHGIAQLSIFMPFFIDMFYIVKKHYGFL